MSFVKKRGRSKFMWLPVTTSTVLTKDSLVAFSSGLLIAATSSTAPSLIVGVVRHAIAATDADYATARLIEVEVPTENYVEWEATVTATLVVGDIGLYCDLTDSATVNRGASTYDIVQIVGFISTTKARVVLNTGVAGCGVIGA